MKGIETFKKAFKKYHQAYVIIGGTACSLLMEDAGTSFRSTKDIDMVLIIEYINEEFAQAFWDFIKKGEYASIFQDSRKTNFYRFQNPQQDGYPVMIELFSRIPQNFDLVAEAHVLPLHISDEISSLSAILLDNDYYTFMKDGIKEIDGISVLDELHLIPFKAKACCELTIRHTQGEEGLTKHIKKHKRDIAVLLTLLPYHASCFLTGQVLQDMRNFLSALEIEAHQEEEKRIFDMTMREFYDTLRKIYHV